LLALSGCEAAKGLSGTLSVGFELNFKTDKVTEIKAGKSTTVDDRTTSALLACARNEFKAASLKDVKHDNDEYSVYYLIEFQPEPEEGSEDAGTEEADDDVVAASGKATVGWQVALIRKMPKEGDIVARLLSGTNVVVTGRKGDWYRVKYNSKGDEGWVYKSAIGL
jgi:hypothetical protein